jgi:dimethylargininase
VELSRAIVRAPGRTYPEALTGREPPPEIDMDLALRQHRGYVATLRHVGLEVTELPPDEEHPDAVFVQDRACVVNGLAITGPSAVPSRHGETAPIVEILRRSHPIVELFPPATLDWGDVLITEDALFVGLSARSNEAAVEQLKSLLGATRRVEGFPVPRGLLHLLSGCSYLGGGRLQAVEALASFARANRFEIVPVAGTEPSAANVIVHAEWAIVPAGYPATAARLESAGFRVQRISVGEFEKRDGGVTCLSVLY